MVPIGSLENGCDIPDASPQEESRSAKAIGIFDGIFNEFVDLFGLICW